MFETTFQTYWADSDPAGIAYYTHFFRYVEFAEEDLFRAAGFERQTLLDEYKIWLPRVECFAKFIRPIFVGDRIIIRLRVGFQGVKVVKCEFEVLNAKSDEMLSEGYVTIVCVNRKNMKSRELPESVREAFMLGQD